MTDDTDPWTVDDLCQAIQDLDDGDGVTYKALCDLAGTDGTSEETFESVVTQALDRGRIVEPVLGRFQLT